MDDEQIVVLVQQFLLERGYKQAFDALQRESGVQYEEERIPKGGELCAMINESFDARQLIDPPLGNSRQKMEEDLLQYSDSPYPSLLSLHKKNYHVSNIICAAFCRGQGNLLATGSTDKSVKILTMGAAEDEEPRVIYHFNSPVLSVSWNPIDDDILLATAMDGSAALIRISDSSIIKSMKDHAKYVIRSCWASDASLFVTSGYDRLLCIYRASADNSLDFVLEKSMQLPAIAESVTFIPDTHVVIVGLREDNYLHHIDLDSGEDSKVNMNSTLDDHVSFTAMDLAVSPDSKFLLVATDKSRLILYPLGESTQLRSFYGAINDALCQCRIAFHPSGKYVFSTSQDQSVLMWDVVSQRVISRLKGHTLTVRDLALDPKGETLASVSFDKSVIIWQPAAAVAAAADK